MTLRQLRESKGISLPRLAEMTGITKGYLSKIERSERLPPVSTLQRMAYALDVDISELISGSAAEDSSGDDKRRDIDIVSLKEAHGKAVSGSSGGYKYASLLHSYGDHQMSPFLMAVEKGRTETFTHDSEEFCHVLEGAVILEYNGRRRRMSKGDSFYFDSRLRHSFINEGDEPAMILAVNYNYRRF